MKTAVCCIGRSENAYIREYVEHYQKLGIDKIFIYDNNYDGEEHFEDVIDDYITDGLVDIIDYRNRTNCQMDAYQDCYDRYGNEYDWILFIDCGDEYLYINGYDNIKEFLSQPQFLPFDIIHINRMNYGDNNLVTQDSRPLRIRFPKPILPLNFTKNYDFPENDHVSSIVRGHLPQVVWNDTPHTPTNELNCCDASGKPCQSNSPFLHPFNYTYAHFKHYTTKTIEEYLNVKVKRGFPDGNKDYFKYNDPVKDFFKVNELTEKKKEYLKRHHYNYDDNVDIFIASHKPFIPSVHTDIYKIIYPYEVINNSTDLPQFYCQNKLRVRQQFYSELYMYMEIPYIINLKKYIGCCHYRRYFQFMDKLPDLDMIFNKYDAIAAKPLFFTKSVRDQYDECHNVHDLDIVKNIIHQDFNEYETAFDNVLNNNILYPYNMFIMKSDDFLKYLQFIDGVLSAYLKIIDYNIEKRLEENKSDYIKEFYPNNTLEYQYRIGGYLAERLTNVFFYQHFKKIKTYDVVITEAKY